MTKPKKDGWVRHRGGKCSAPELSVVEVHLRNGAVLPAHDCERFTWEHSAVEAGRQIMAYRVVDMREPVSYDDDYCDCSGPIQWRDLIREIDTEQKAADVAYKEATDHRAAQRASLVAKLKAEGFALIQGDEANGAVESAHGEQDMDDPANWRAGDLVKSIDDEADDIRIGGVYRLWKDPNVDGGYLYLIDSDGDKRNRCIENYAFHSRHTP